MNEKGNSEEKARVLSNAETERALKKKWGNQRDDGIARCRHKDNNDPPVPRYFVRTYTKAQEGKEIKSEDVIRAQNGIWYSKEETKQLRTRSEAGCPTYGTCNMCFSSVQDQWVTYVNVVQLMVRYRTIITSTR